MLKPFLPITLYLEPPRVVDDKAFLFRHILQTFYVSAAIGKLNCLAIAKHLFTTSKPHLSFMIKRNCDARLYVAQHFYFSACLFL